MRSLCTQVTRVRDPYKLVRPYINSSSCSTSPLVQCAWNNAYAMIAPQPSHLTCFCGRGGRPSPAQLSIAPRSTTEVNPAAASRAAAVAVRAPLAQYTTTSLGAPSACRNEDGAARQWHRRGSPMVC